MHKGPVQAKVCVVRSFKKCDKDKLMADLAKAPWQVMDTFDDIDVKWSYWRTMFFSVVDRHAPLVKVRIRERGRDDDWVDSHFAT